jgi:hypothetical protein
MVTLRELSLRKSVCGTFPSLVRGLLLAGLSRHFDSLMFDLRIFAVQFLGQALGFTAFETFGSTTRSPIDLRLPPNHVCTTHCPSYRPDPIQEKWVLTPGVSKSMRVPRVPSSHRSIIPPFHHSTVPSFHPSTHKISSSIVSKI